MNNSGYSSDQGSTLTQYTDVMERRQNADPVARAHRLSADQPSLAGKRFKAAFPHVHANNIRRLFADFLPT